MRLGRCSCGWPLYSAPSRVLNLVACPACGRVMPSTDGAGRLGLRLVGVAAVCLLVVTGLGFGLIRLSPPPQRAANPSPPTSAPLPGQQVEDIPPVAAPVAVKPVDAPPAKPSAALSIPEPPGPDTPPQVVRTDPDT